MSERNGWWRFTGSNLESLYGFGSEAHVELYLADVLNKGKSVNFYAAEFLGDTDLVAADYLGFNPAERGGFDVEYELPTPKPEESDAYAASLDRAYDRVNPDR